MKLDNISSEAKLLCKHHIDTTGQLFSYLTSLKTEISALTDERKTLYNKSRSVKGGDKRSEIKTEISVLSKRLTALRREVHLCEDIAIRSGIIKEKIKAVRENGKSNGREKTNYEQFRGRSGANRQNGS